jgi:hypothetical protein
VGFRISDISPPISEVSARWKASMKLDESEISDEKRQRRSRRLQKISLENSILLSSLSVDTEVHSISSVSGISEDVMLLSVRLQDIANIS